MSFESRRAAEERLRAKVQATQCQKKKDHTGTIKDINWDKEKLKQEVDGYEDGVKINWSDLARKYDIKKQIRKFCKKWWTDSTAVSCE